MAYTYPTAGSSMLPTWSTTQQPVNVSTQQNMSYASGGTGQYQGPMLPGQDQTAFRTSGIERSGGSNPMLSSGGYGSVLGASTVAQPTSSGSSTGTQQSQPSGFNRMDPNANPGGGYWWDAANGWQAPSAPSGPSDQELDAAYNPLFDYLNQAESALRQDYPTYGKEIEAQYGTSKQALENSMQSGKRSIDSQLESGNRQKMDVISDARRMFNELMMANQQRFGGASSAGQAASELQSREFQRGVGKAQEQYTQLTQELGVKKLELDQNYQLSLRQLDDKKMASLNEVNRQFQEKLMQINQQRANTSAEKAARRLQALQDYRNQTYAIQVQNYQMQQQLQMMREQSQIELDNYAQQLAMSRGGATNAYNSFSSGLSTPSYSRVTAGGQQQAPGMVGYKQDDELKGYAPGLYDRKTGQQIGSSNTARFVN